MAIIKKSSMIKRLFGLDFLTQPILKKDIISEKADKMEFKQKNKSYMRELVLLKKMGKIENK